MATDLCARGLPTCSLVGKERLRLSVATHVSLNVSQQRPSRVHTQSTSNREPIVRQSTFCRGMRFRRIALISLNCGRRTLI